VNIRRKHQHETLALDELRETRNTEGHQEQAQAVQRSGVCLATHRQIKRDADDGADAECVSQMAGAGSKCMMTVATYQIRNTTAQSCRR
jgi:hypothetical protein